MAPLTIGIDARAAVEEPAGRGQVVRELVRALAARDDEHRYVLFVRARWDVDLDERFTQVIVRSGDPLWHVRVARAANRRCDVFLDTNSYLLAWFLRIPAVVIVYDLVAFRPDVHPQPRAAAIERATIGRAVRRAHSLLAISESTRRDLVERLPDAAARARVVHIAASPVFSRPVPDAAIAAARREHGLEGPFVLSAGTIEPRKNLVRLVRAWATLPDEVRGGRVLALVGRRGWQLDEIVAEIDAHPDAVRLLGYVAESDLVALYHACDVFCYPSLYEGFGLPVHEAMCCGAAVLTAGNSSLPEVAGEAALLVDARDERAIADGLKRLLGDGPLRERLRAAALQQSQRFDWATTAAAVVESLRAAARAR